jgi:hypothetical protein
MTSTLPSPVMSPTGWTVREVAPVRAVGLI